MNAKAAKRIRYAVRCMGLKDGPTQVNASTVWYKNTKPAVASAAARKVTQFKREYKELPFHRRDVHQESHSFVLRVKHGNTIRNFPA